MMAADVLTLTAPGPKQHKRCRDCRTVKPVAEFGRNRRIPDGYQVYCRSCTAARGLKSRLANPERHRRYVRRNYERHKAKILARGKVIRGRRLQKLIAQLKGGPCQDCHQHFLPCAMDFDHRPGEVKCFQFGGSALVRHSLETTLAEIAKCDLVCANCHRVRTWRRKQEERS